MPHNSQRGRGMGWHTNSSVPPALVGLILLTARPLEAAAVPGALVSGLCLFSYDPATVRFDERLRERTDKVAVWEIRFPSPVTLGPPSNLTVWAEYFQPLHPARTPHPVVLCLHTLGSGHGTLSRDLINTLVNRGTGGVLLELPYHMHRRPPGSSAGREFVRPDTSHLIEVLRQAVIELRCVVDWLSRRPEVDESKLGLAGHSLGAIVGGLAYAVEPRLKAAALAGGGALLHELVWRSLILVEGRNSLVQQGVTKEALATILAPVDACNYATPERGKSVLMINALHDCVVPGQCTRAMGRPMDSRRSGGSTAVTSLSLPTRTRSTPRWRRGSPLASVQASAISLPT